MQMKIWRFSSATVESHIYDCLNLITKSLLKLIHFLSQQVKGQKICGKLQSRDWQVHATGQEFTGSLSLNLHNAESHLL